MSAGLSTEIDFDHQGTDQPLLAVHWTEAHLNGFSCQGSEISLGMFLSSNTKILCKLDFNYKRSVQFN